MKLRLRRNEDDQVPVGPMQETMRRSVPRMVPVLRALGIALALACLIALFWLWWSSSRVYAYGMVSGRTVNLTCPERSRLDALYVEPGDRVRAGDVLFVLASDDAAGRLKGVEEELRRQQLRLAALGGASDDPAQEVLDETRSLDAAEARLGQIQRDAVAARAAMAQQAAAQQAAVEDAAREAERAAAAAHPRQERMAEVQRLRRLEAATIGEERQAADEAREAAFRLQLAEAGLARVRDAAARGAAEREAAGLRLDESLAAAAAERERLLRLVGELGERRARERGRAKEEIASRIEALKAEVKVLAAKAGPHQVRAEVDGLVLEVPESPGSQLAADAVVMRLVDAGALWIDAYVPSEQGGRLERMKEAGIHPSTGGGTRRGSVSVPGRISVPVPPQLRLVMPGQTHALQVRVDVADPAGLVPGTVVKVVLTP